MRGAERDPARADDVRGGGAARRGRVGRGSASPLGHRGAATAPAIDLLSRIGFARRSATPGPAAPVASVPAGAPERRRSSPRRSVPGRRPPARRAAAEPRVGWRLGSRGPGSEARAATTSTTTRARADPGATDQGTRPTRTGDRCAGGCEAARVGRPGRWWSGPPRRGARAALACGRANFRSGRTFPRRLRPRRRPGRTAPASGGPAPAGVGRKAARRRCARNIPSPAPCSSGPWFVPLAASSDRPGRPSRRPAPLHR